MKYFIYFFVVTGSIFLGSFAGDVQYASADCLDPYAPVDCVDDSAGSVGDTSVPAGSGSGSGGNDSTPAGTRNTSTGVDAPPRVGVDAPPRVGVDAPARIDAGIKLFDPIEKSIEDIFRAILDIIMVFAIPIVIFFIVLAGFKYVTAGGSETKIEEATKALTYAVIGGLLVLGANVLLAVITNTIKAIAN